MKPGIWEDARHSPPWPILACSPQSGLLVSYGTFFAAAPHCYQVTRADPSGSLWMTAFPWIFGYLCSYSPSGKSGTGDVVGSGPSTGLNDPEVSWVSAVGSFSAAKACLSGLKITIAGLAHRPRSVSVAEVTFLMTTIWGSSTDITTVSDAGVGEAGCSNAWTIGLGCTGRLCEVGEL